MRELSIVVTCTGRKSLAPAPGLSVRDLPGDTLPRRSDIWRQRLAGSDGPQRRLRDLYMGEAWQRSLRLEQHAAAAGFAPTLYVASAGLGLRRVDDRAPAYAATFATRHEDTVANTLSEGRRWWAERCADPGAAALATLPLGPTLVVLSEAYTAPLADDLSRLAAHTSETLVVGGASPVPGVRHLRANKSLRVELGGTVMSLNQRIAATWLDRLQGRDLVAEDAFREWDTWTEQVRKTESWNRRPMSDDAVMSAIRSLREADPRVSRSAALRSLRDSGFACEQRRFGALYQRVVEET